MSQFISKQWAEYATDGLKPPFVVYRYDDKAEHRFYFFKDNEGNWRTATGVTSVFGRIAVDEGGIQRWKEDHPNWRELLNATAEYGTLEHSVFGDVMIGLGVNPEKIKSMQSLAFQHNQPVDMPEKDVYAFLKFHEDVALKPLLIEAVLVWRDPETGQYLAMTIDLLAELTTTITEKKEIPDGVFSRGKNAGKPRFRIEKNVIEKREIVLVDFKSNFFGKDKKSYYINHKLQLIAAKRAVEQSFGLKVDKMFNWSPNNWRTEPSYTFTECVLNDNSEAKFNARWNLAVVEELNVPSGSIFVSKGFGSSKDYEYVSYLDYVKKIMEDGQVQDKGIS